MVSVPPAESAQKMASKDAIANNTKVNEKEKEKETTLPNDVTDVPMVQETAGTIFVLCLGLMETLASQGEQPLQF